MIVHRNKDVDDMSDDVKKAFNDLFTSLGEERLNPEMMEHIATGGLPLPSQGIKLYPPQKDTK